ncbi:MAG TPA: glycosyltransferase family 2 protein [Bacteroidales bacterium]|nr:glycosyltransferase family 2 protein [Bacteroidales bacterium]
MDLSIIILNFNGKSWLENLLTSLQSYWLNQTRYVTEVVVVDNASTDDSVSYLQSLSGIRLICSDQNGGFAYGNNLALRNNPSRYVMLLNSDTEFLPQGSNLDSLIEYMDEEPNVGIVTPNLRLDSGLPDSACHRGEPTPWAAFTYFSGLERMFPRSKMFGQYHQTFKSSKIIHNIDACSGAAMLVRNDAISKVGLLDEQFFMYAEDIDWCRRFREAGYQVMYYPEVTLIHHKYQSGLGNSDDKIKKEVHKWFYMTMLQYYDKHYKKKYPPFYRWALKGFLALKR